MVVLGKGTPAVKMGSLMNERRHKLEKEANGGSSFALGFSTLALNILFVLVKKMVLRTIQWSHAHKLPVS